MLSLAFAVSFTWAAIVLNKKNTSYPSLRFAIFAHSSILKSYTKKLNLKILIEFYYPLKLPDNCFQTLSILNLNSHAHGVQLWNYTWYNSARGVDSFVWKTEGSSFPFAPIKSSFHDQLCLFSLVQPSYGWKSLNYFPIYSLYCKYYEAFLHEAI